MSFTIWTALSVDMNLFRNKNSDGNFTRNSSGAKKIKPLEMEDCWRLSTGPRNRMTG